MSLTNPWYVFEVPFSCSGVLIKYHDGRFVALEHEDVSASLAPELEHLNGTRRGKRRTLHHVEFTAVEAVMPTDGTSDIAGKLTGHG